MCDNLIIRISIHYFIVFKLYFVIKSSNLLSVGSIADIYLSNTTIFLHAPSSTKSLIVLYTQYSLAIPHTTISSYCFNEQYKALPSSKLLKIEYSSRFSCNPFL